MTGLEKDPRHTWKNLMLSSELFNVDETRTNRRGCAGWDERSTRPYRVSLPNAPSFSSPASHGLNPKVNCHAVC